MKESINVSKKSKTVKKERSIKDFKIDTSHYKSYGPRVVRVIDIDY